MAKSDMSSNSRVPSDRSREASHRRKEVWEEHRARALEAALAAWQYTRDHVPICEVPHSPFLYKPTWPSIHADVGAWREYGEFLAVDTELSPKVCQNRLRLEYERFDGRKLYVHFPTDVKGHLEYRDYHFRIFKTDPKEALARRWVSALEEIGRGPQAADLWSPRDPRLHPVSPDYLPPERRLNERQQLALAAMTTRGGYFIWGPPGTGKTTVITSAVKDALEHQRSVLITSHTHVAVDNVLRGLIEDDRVLSLNLLHPGVVVRKSPGDDQKVDPAVRDHPFMMDDKAAAMKVRLEERRKELESAEEANRVHPDRTREKELGSQVHHLDPKDEGVRQLDKCRPSYDRLESLQSEQKDLDRAAKDVSGQIVIIQRRIDNFSGLDEETIHCSSSIREAEYSVVSWRNTLCAVQSKAEQFRNQYDMVSQQIEAESRPSLLPWVKRDRQAKLDKLRPLQGQLWDQLKLSENQFSQSQAALAEAERALNYWQQQNHILKQRKSEHSTLLHELQNLQVREISIKVKKQETEEELQTCINRVGDPDEFIRRWRQAETDGSLALVRQWNEYALRVARLNQELDDIHRHRRALEDEYRQIKRSILDEAAVVATTLDSIVYSDQLLKRRFDVVIIDEVASAEAAKVFYAASKADQTCALVGDFLQNQPVASAEDATNEPERLTRSWQLDDIFSLAGIVDRKSAEENPHSVALSVQYRFPPVIADAVNEFCYDGLLESAQSDPHQTVVVFHDLSTRLGIQFERTNDSWRCRSSLNVAAEIARSIFSGSIGFVTPYKAQSNLAQDLFGASTWDGHPVEAGTSHAFQGREFDTVIVDLMQDSEPRWVAAADIHGPDRGRSAARLLNVAMTRAKKVLHLIGDWNFVSQYDSPGMRALHNLQYHPTCFEVIHHR